MPESFEIDRKSLRVLVTPKNDSASLAVSWLLMDKLRSLLDAFENGCLEREQILIDRCQWRPGHILQFYRERTGCTQLQLAEAAGVGVSRVSRIESHKLIPGKKTALKLSRVIGCHYVELIA